MTSDTDRRGILAGAAAAAALSVLPQPGRSAAEARAARQAAASVEPGNEGWRIQGHRRPTVVGYPVAESILPGETLQLRLRFFVTDTQGNDLGGGGTCDVSFYRVGYDGSGQDGFKSQVLGYVVAPSDAFDQQDDRAAELFLTESTRWDTLTVQTDENWTPGFYVAKIVEPQSGDASQAYFVVRTPVGTKCDILAVVPFNTAQAYNNFGGRSLYGFGATPSNAAYGVSYNRPLEDGYEDEGVTSPSYGFSHIWSSFPSWYWLEQQQEYNVGYVSDTDFEPAESGAGSGGAIALLEDPGSRPSALLVTGHSEYWSKAMVDAFYAARDGDAGAGLSPVNLLFLCGNTAYWRVRFEGRRMICYKDDWTKDSVVDPDTGGPTPTNLWRSGENGRPENALLGVMSVSDDGISTGAPFHSATGPGVVGWEWDTLVYNGAGPGDQGQQDPRIMNTWTTDRSLGAGVADPFGQSPFQALSRYPSLGSQPVFSDVRLPTLFDQNQREFIVNGGQAFELGLQFTALQSGYVTNARYFLGPDEPDGPSPRVATLWRGGEIIGTTAFNDFAQSRGGWCQLAMSDAKGGLVSVNEGETLMLSVTVNSQYGYSLGAFGNGARSSDSIFVDTGSAFYSTMPGHLPDTAAPDQGAYYFIDLQFLPADVLPDADFDRSTAILWRAGASLTFAAGCINWGAGLAQPAAGDMTKQLSNATDPAVRNVTRHVLQQMFQG